MNFFIDFEATRFSNRIISIGCVAENGETFSTLVNPGPKYKIDNFITELTGITNEMLTTAPDPDTAFYLLDIFIVKNNYDNKPPVYYVYGNSDIDFLKATLKDMKNVISCTRVQAIIGGMIDYAEIVKKFFMSNHEMALRKVYMTIKHQQEMVQKHDALEDAKMLETVFSNLHLCKPEDKELIKAIPSQKKPKTGTTAPEKFLALEGQKKWEVDTGANENLWVIKCWDQHTNDTIYFMDLDTAAYWVIKYVAKNVSPKNNDSVKKIKNKIIKAYENNKCSYNCFWNHFANEEEVE